MKMNSREKIEYSKTLLKNYATKVDMSLEAYWEKAIKNVRSTSRDVKKIARILLEHAKDHNTRGGKRLRAAFVRYGYRLIDSNPDEDLLIDVAISNEITHTALLMFDDFMDRDSIRRGGITSNAFYKKYHEENLALGDASHYGDSIAVDSGIFVLSLGYKQVLNSKYPLVKRLAASNILMDGIIETAYGQAYDLTLEAMDEFSESNILNLHTSKTAVYTYRTPLFVGATLAGASREDLELISKYSLPAGVAFQLQDDVLGLFGDTEKTGKASHADLREGKKTLLIYMALKRGDSKQVDTIMANWGNPDIDESDAEAVREIVIATGALEYSKKVALKYAQKAQESINEMRRRGWDEESINFLDGIAEYMAVGREF